MNVFYKIIIWFCLYFIGFSSYPLDYDVSDKMVWPALKNHVMELIKQKDYKQALTLVDDFCKKHSNSSFVSEALLMNAEINLRHLGNIEIGFNALEKVIEKSEAKDKLKVQELKDEFSNGVTVIRLEKISYFIEKYFVEKQEFPESLNLLTDKYKSLTSNTLKDGYGHNMGYIIRDSVLFSGEDKLKFMLFSKGKDGIENTADDIHYSGAKKQNESDKLKVVSTFMDSNMIWFAEIAYNESGSETKNLKVQEGDVFGAYEIFSIGEYGVVFVNNDKIFALRK